MQHFQQPKHKGYFRIRFSPKGHQGTFFFFGLAYRQRSWMLREGENKRDLDTLELLAGLEIWEESDSDEGSASLGTYLEGAGPGKGPNWTIESQLNAAIKEGPEIFVPLARDRRKWTRFVRRQSTRELPTGRDAQVAAMADFYGSFLAAFRVVDGTVLGAPTRWGY